MVTKVAFVCVHNSCRSQIAEALGRIVGMGIIKCYSAGTEKRECMNQDAVRLMKELGVDMELNQKPKLLSELPEIDIVITMGCNVDCPLLPCKHREDWGIEDPTGKSNSEYRFTINQIKEKLDNLINRIQSHTL